LAEGKDLVRFLSVSGASTQAQGNQER
jgi:hypothetical protein